MIRDIYIFNKLSALHTSRGAYVNFSLWQFGMKLIASSMFQHVVAIGYLDFTLYFPARPGVPRGGVGYLEEQGVSTRVHGLSYQ